jgi:hypothetical protein
MHEPLSPHVRWESSQSRCTVQIAPVAGSNGVGDVSREINYMSSHSSLGAQLANGTQPFNPSIVANCCCGTDNLAPTMVHSHPV